MTGKCLLFKGAFLRCVVYQLDCDTLEASGYHLEENNKVQQRQIHLQSWAVLALHGSVLVEVAGEEQAVGTARPGAKTGLKLGSPSER